MRPLASSPIRSDRLLEAPTAGAVPLLEATRDTAIPSDICQIACAFLAVALCSSPLAAAGQQAQAPPPSKQKKACTKKMMAKDCAALSPTKAPTKLTTAARRLTRTPTDHPTRFPTASSTRRTTAELTTAPTFAPTLSATASPVRPPLPTTCPGVNGTMASYNGHLYVVVSTVRIWNNAESHLSTLECCSKKGHHVTVTSLQEKAAMEAVLMANPSTLLWLGLYEKDGNGTWAWTGMEGDVDTANTDV